MTTSSAKDSRFSYFHRLVRWFYRIVFGFIGFGLFGSLVQGFVLTFVASGTINLPTIKQAQQIYLVHLALRSPGIVWSATFLLIGLGVLGFSIDQRFNKSEKVFEQKRLEVVAHVAGSHAAGQVIEEKGPVIVQSAVKQGIEEAAVIQTAVEKGFQRAIKERDTIGSEMRSETTSWKPPKDIAVLPLPPAASGLVGREEVQEWLAGCILAGKIVEVSGMGGIGKTTLVADTINKVASLFHSGGIAAILANDETNPTIILRQLVEKFVPNGQELLSRPDTKINILYEALSYTLSMHREKDHRVLIVIDGVEPGLVRNRGLEQLCNIFRSTQVSVVMTTREPLSTRLVQESRELEEFSKEAAVDLLTRLLEGFLHRSLSGAERHDAAGICKIAGNHAQAIVLIAGYFEHHLHVSLASYLRRLKRSPKLVLDLTDRLRPIETSEGVRLTFASSYAQLEKPAQSLFIALGALTGRGCTYQAVQALGIVLDQSEDEIQSSLVSLIRSKLVLKPITGPLTTIERIHLHPLVQEFARELLRSLSDFSEDAFYEMLAAHYAEWVPRTSADLLTDDDDANLIAALRWAKAHTPQSDVILAKLIYNLRWYWQSQFQFEEAFTWLLTGYEVMERLGTDWYKQKGELLFAMGSQYQWMGDLSEAERCYKKSYTLFGKISSKVDSRAGQAEALSGLAALAQQRGNTEKAQRDYQRSLLTFRKAHDRRCEADALYRLGFLALRTGNIDDAFRYYEDSLAIHLSLGDDQWGEAIIRHSLGTVYQQIGEIDNAGKYYEDGLSLCRKSSNRRGEGIILKALGDLALQTTGPIEAEKYLTQSHDISYEIFDPQSQSVELYSMGFLFRQTGRVDEARNYYNQSLEIREKIKDERGKGFTHKGLGELARRMGEMVIAKEHLELGLEISKKIKDRRNEGVALKALGDWAWQAGNMDTARGYYEESLSIRKDCRDLRGEAITLKVLGDLALLEGYKTSTHDYLHQSLTLFRQLKDRRGEGITLHSLAILALEEGNRAIVQEYLDRSLALIREVQDQQSEGSVLYIFALWAEIRGDLSQSEEYYRQSMQIATEIQAAYNLAIFQEALGDFLIRRTGQRGKNEGDLLLIQAAETYEQIGRNEDAGYAEERRLGRHKIRERDKLMRAIIYDLDDGPNGQSFAVPNERRSARCSP